MTSSPMGGGGGGGGLLYFSNGGAYVKLFSHYDRPLFSKTPNYRCPLSAARNFQTENKLFGT